MKKKIKDIKPTSKQKDLVMGQLLLFVQGLALNEVTQSSYHYLMDAVHDKSFTFNKEQRADHFAWIRKDMAEVYEIWENIAFGIYKDHKVSKKLVKLFFNNCVDRLEKEWEKQYKVGKNGSTKRTKA